MKWHFPPLAYFDGNLSLWNCFFFFFLFVWLYSFYRLPKAGVGHVVFSPDVTSVRECASVTLVTIVNLGISSAKKLESVS